jgi:uncharacterized protein YndB with AHSA1/START domain
MPQLRPSLARPGWRRPGGSAAVDAVAADMTTVSVDIAAPAEAIWAMVSDHTRKGEWSPETVKVEWLDGATEPSVGARFRGTNRHGVYRWSTTCTIVACDPPSELAWDVTTVFGIKVAQWRYQIERTGELSCRVTESTLDQRAGWFAKLIGRVGTGVEDRAAHNEAGMRATLERLKVAAEPAPA